MKFLVCEGSPAQIGETVGESLREEIRLHESIAARAYENKNFENRLAVFRKNLQERQPKVFEEIAGMARGANLPTDTILRLNIEPVPCGLDGALGNCSNVVFTAGPNGPMLGKNNDGNRPHLPFYMKKVVPEKGIPLITITFAGLVFVTDALNAEGVAVGHSSVGSVFDQSDYHANIRLWAYEAMQKARTTREFVRFMCETPLRGKGYSHVSVDKTGDACSLEAACPLMQVREAKHPAGMSCVNHFQLPHLASADRRTPEAKVISQQRMAYIESVLESETVFDVALMQKMLSHHGKPGALCRHAGAESLPVDTEYAFIALPAAGKWLYKTGHPCQGEFQTVLL